MFIPFTLNLKRRQEYQRWSMIVCDFESTCGFEAPVYIRPPWLDDLWYVKLYYKLGCLIWRIKRWLLRDDVYDDLPKNGVLYIVQEDGTLKESK